MQIAAASPTYLSRTEVSADILEKERDIYRDQMKASGKPANIIEQIVDGAPHGLREFEQRRCFR